MRELLTAAQMRAIEAAAIESGAVTGLELMERAGQGVISAILAAWPDLGRAPQKAVVLCGPGNNGGDGFVVARLLKDRGWDVAVYLYGSPERLPPDARDNHDRWRRMVPVAELRDAPISADRADLFVDALFGTGLRRPLEGAARDWAVASASDPGMRDKTVAVDLPSGLCSDSGRVLGAGAETVRAALAVTFHAPKLGHYLAAGPERCGRVTVADIGLSQGAGACAVRLVAPPHERVRTKPDGLHKYGHGHALILSGGAGRTGAARLAARGALRIGAGLVTLGVPGAAQQEVACQITALMLARVEDGAALQEVLKDHRLNALCLGPGMGVARARALVPIALRVPAPEPGPRGRGLGSGPGRAVVLDADALTAFAEDPEALFKMLHADCVLTPHGGEFARLFPDIAARLTAPASDGPAYSKVEATRAAARRAGCVVLFKGPDTVIAAPDGRCWIHSARYNRAAPWLATAGSGDVLAGFITGLLARGLPPEAATQGAAWLHVETARQFGPGLIAEDLPEILPTVLRDPGG